MQEKSQQIMMKYENIVSPTIFDSSQDITAADFIEGCSSDTSNSIMQEACNWLCSFAPPGMSSIISPQEEDQRVASLTPLIAEYVRSSGIFKEKVVRSPLSSYVSSKNDFVTKVFLLLLALTATTTDREHSLNNHKHDENVRILFGHLFNTQRKRGGNRTSQPLEMFAGLINNANHQHPEVRRISQEFWKWVVVRQQQQRRHSLIKMTIIIIVMIFITIYVCHWQAWNELILSTL